MPRELAFLLGCHGMSPLSEFVSTFNASFDAIVGSSLKPLHRKLNVIQSAGIGRAYERPTLERCQPVLDNGK